MLIGWPEGGLVVVRQRFGWIAQLERQLFDRLGELETIVAVAFPSPDRLGV
jgi:hypothetical protein